MSQPIIFKLKTLSFWKKSILNFYEKDGFDAVTVLAYTSLVGIVPFLAVIISVLSATEIFKHKTTQVLSEVLVHFLPSTSPMVEKYLIQFSTHASHLQGIGLLVVFVTSLLMLWSIDNKINSMWDKNTQRKLWVSLVRYLGITLVGPILLVGSMFLTSMLTVMNLPVMTNFQTDFIVHLPVMINLLGFWVLYQFVPVQKIKPLASLLGALFVTLGLELLKQGFTFYVTWFPTYDLIYGAFAVIPLFLLWIYSVWMLVVYGASMVFQLNFEEEPLSED